MSISHVDAATGTTTCTVPTHAIGDIIVIFAFRDGSTTAPSLGAGFTSIATKSGTSCSHRIGFKIATSTSDASGTWTNASVLTCTVLRSSLYGTGGSLFIGKGVGNSAGTTNTLTFNSVTITHADSTSYVAGFIGHRSVDQAISTHPPSGMTLITNSELTNATAEVCAFDTNGTVNSWTSTNVSVTGTASGWTSETIEIMENQPGTILNNALQMFSFTYQDANASGETDDFYVWEIEPSLPNNGLLAAFIYQDAGHTPSLSDDKGNTWGSPDETAGIGSGGTVLAVYHINNITTGTSQVFMNLGGNPQSQVQAKFIPLYNVTGTLEGHSSITATAPVAGVVTGTAYTPSVNNCVIFTFLANGFNTVNTNPALIVPDTNMVLDDADISFGANGMPHASSYTSQGTAASYTPRWFLNTSNAADGWHVVSVALSTGSQGTLPATGPGEAPFVKKILQFGSNVSVPITVLFQIPSEGNGGAFGTFFDTTTTGGNPHLTSMIDNDGVTWTLNQPLGTSDGLVMPTRFNSAQRTDRNITAVLGGTGQNYQFVYYDIANLATSSTIVASVGTDGSSGSTTGATITPTAAKQLTIAYLQIGTGPSTVITAPTGAVYDLARASQWKGTGSINGTTWTRTTTTWGSIFTNSPVLSGAGISGGTAPTAGGPTTYTINPNNGVIALEAMSLSTSDTNALNWGNGAGHYYNGASTAAQAWNFTVSLNTTPGGGKFVALILAGPPGASFLAARPVELLQAVKRASYI